MMSREEYIEPSPGGMPVRSYIAAETHKRMNLGTTIRCGVAFAIDHLVVVGSPKFGTHGAHGSHKYIDAMHYFYWDNFFADMKTQGVTTVGISPKPIASTDATRGSKALDSVRFDERRSYAFVLTPSNSQASNGSSVMERCDHIIHVNYPLGPEANDFILYDASISLVLLKYRTDTKATPHSFTSEKFVLAEAPRSHGVRMMDAHKVDTSAIADDIDIDNDAVGSEDEEGGADGDFMFSMFDSTA